MIKKRKKELRKKVLKNCLFCQEKKRPEWRQSSQLAKFLSPRGRILSRSMTGLCAKHQKQLTLAIKHARHLALLPFVI